MDFDFKITTWERVTVEGEEYQRKVYEAIRSGEIQSASDVFDFLSTAGMDTYIECERITDVDEQMTVSENGGEATIEILKDTDLIWKNS